jgi:hypothetical protein
MCERACTYGIGSGRPYKAARLLIMSTRNVRHTVCMYVLVDCGVICTEPNDAHHSMVY